MLVDFLKWEKHDHNHKKPKKIFSASSNTAEGATLNEICGGIEKDMGSSCGVPKKFSLTSHTLQRGLNKILDFALPSNGSLILVQRDLPCPSANPARFFALEI